MNAKVRGPVWIDPPRFWAVVARMTENEVEALLENVSQLWQDGNIEALLQFDFVTGVGYPYPGQGSDRRNAAYF